MLYKQITFQIEVPVSVDWGDGNVIQYPAGEITGTPKGEVIITSTEPVEEINFLTDTISQAAFDEAADYKYANELFKDKRNIQVVYFDKNSPIVTTRQAFANSGIIYHADMAHHRPQQLQYMHLHAHRLQCVEGLDTRHAFNAYGLFEDTPLLKHPRPFEIAALEDTNAGGCHYENTFQCVYPVFHNNFSLSKVQFEESIKLPDGYEMYYPFLNGIVQTPKRYSHYVRGCHVNPDSLYFDGNRDYIIVHYSPQYDQGTATVWVKRRSDGRNYDTIFAESGSASQLIAWIPSDNKLWFQLDGSYKGRCASSVTIPENVWTHIAVTYSTTDVVLYINGEVVGGVDNVAMSGGFWQRAHDNLSIGGSPYATSMYGWLKHFRWYNKVLSQDEIKVIYNSGV